MSPQSNPYNRLPYRCLPIEWTAPERLKLASMLHGGPRPSLDGYRLLELGCGNGANLLPLAYYRGHAEFFGVDGARTQIEVAETRKSELGLGNVEFLHADFLVATESIPGDFDYIVAHGVFSWVPDCVRDALLKLCVHKLRPNGLLYLNYNTRPGWNVRGMVREFLVAQTYGAGDLLTRGQDAQTVSARIASSLAAEESPYSQLLANEFQFVSESHVSYVVHEYLSTDNHSYWRSEFISLVESHGFEYVADADFSFSSGRIGEGLAPALAEEGIMGRSLEDTVDLLSHRQLHSPILTRGPFTRHPPDVAELENLIVASCLSPCSGVVGKNPMFQHPSGYQVEAKDAVVDAALTKLRPLWPRGLRLTELFSAVEQVAEDLKLLQRNGLIELRCIEPGDCGVAPNRLNVLEEKWGAYATTPYHTREAQPSGVCLDVSTIVGEGDRTGGLIQERSERGDLTLFQGREAWCTG